MVEVDGVVNAGRLQGVALQVQRLGAVGRRDAGVADQPVSQTNVCDMAGEEGSGLTDACQGRGVVAAALRQENAGGYRPVV